MTNSHPKGILSNSIHIIVLNNVNFERMVEKILMLQPRCNTHHITKKVLVAKHN